jgi:hypothetical protein
MDESFETVAWKAPPQDYSCIEQDSGFMCLKLLTNSSPESAVLARHAAIRRTEKPRYNHRSHGVLPVALVMSRCRQLRRSGRGHVDYGFNLDGGDPKFAPKGITQSCRSRNNPPRFVATK